MANTSVIYGEAALSAFSISRPATLSPRPYSSHVSSAQFHVMQYTDDTQRIGPCQHKRFPNIQNLEISPSNGIKNSSKKVSMASDKESAFPNFRLLQRLAASAKARISNETAYEGKQIDTNGVEIEENKKHGAKSQSSTAADFSLHDVLNSSVPSCVKMPSPPVDRAQDHKRNNKVKRPKSRRHRRLKTKKHGKQIPSEAGHTSFHILQPTSSKIIPTFSQRFRKQRDRQARKKANTLVGQPTLSNNLSNEYYFSLSAYPQHIEVSKAEASKSDIDDRSDTEDKTDNRHVLKEAKLRAIYNSSQDLNSSTSNGLRKVKLKRVFQSEKQSGSISQCGRLFPCAPPTSPTPETLEKFEFVPSLADLRSQQTVKQRLATLEKERKKKQHANEQDMKRKESQLLLERCKAERARHRQEIYALNKIMTKLERDNFTNFQEKKGVTVDDKRF